MRDVRKWTAKAGGRAQVTEEAEQEPEDDECEEVDEEDEDDEVDDVEDSEAEEETIASSSVTSRRWMSRSAQTRCVTPLVIKAEGEPPSNERLNQVVDLEEKTRALVQGHGGSVDGVWLAGKVAAEFNLYVRENSKRNDGSLKKWLMSTPGLVVENAKQQNNWSVRLA